MQLHKDGNTARCPRFGHRFSYMGRHAIVCRAGEARHGTEFASKSARDDYYTTYCCDCTRCKTCAGYDRRKEHV